MKKKSKEQTIEYLEKLNAKNSKSENLIVDDLSISPYLKDQRISKEERELLFKLRSRTVAVKVNFKNAYFNNVMLCQLCKIFRCTQAHPNQCPKLKTKLIVDKSITLSEGHVYGSTDKQLIYVQIYKRFLDEGQKLLDEMKK